MFRDWGEVPFSTLVAAVAGGLAAVWGVLLFFRQRHMVFMPSRNIIATPADIGEPFDEVRLRCKSGPVIHCWFIPGRRNGKLFIVFPGSIGNISHELATAEFLLSLGASLLMVEYPGFGRSQGEVSESGWHESAEAAWNFARTEAGFSGDSVALFGRSLGCVPALELASRQPCAGVIFHSGFTSVPDLAFHRYWPVPVHWFCYISMDTRARAANCALPILFIYPESDEIVPLKNIRAVFDCARSPKLFVTTRGSHYGNRWLSTEGVAKPFVELLEGRTAAWTA